jgi:hypothetical protein
MRGELASGFWLLALESRDDTCLPNGTLAAGQGGACAFLLLVAQGNQNLAKTP